MDRPFGEFDGWPGTYWLERVGDQKIEPPDLSKREYYEENVKDRERIFKKESTEENLKKLNQAKRDLFTNISEPIGLYRAYVWKYDILFPLKG